MKNKKHLNGHGLESDHSDRLKKLNEISGCRQLTCKSYHSYFLSQNDLTIRILLYRIGDLIRFSSAYMTPGATTGSQTIFEFHLNKKGDP